MRWKHFRPVSTSAFLLILAASGLASDGSFPLEEIDKKVDQAIVRTINLGAPLYNRGDHAGCYRLYQGALMVIEPMLGHRPEQRKAVAKGLRDVEILPTYAQRATELRKALDLVLFAVRSAPILARTPTPNVPNSQPLWARLGGEARVKAVVHDFVALAARDPQVDFSRGGMHPLDAEVTDKLEALLVEFISAASGGPLRYRGREMKTVHQNMAITDAQFDALAGDLGVALRKYEVPKKETEELLAIVAATRKDVVGSPSADTSAPPPPSHPSAALTLWARLGGETAVKAMVHDFIALAGRDARVDFSRGGMHPLDAKATDRLEALFVELISAVSGGPLDYEGRDMKTVHQNMAITVAQFDAMADDLAMVLRKYEVPKKETGELLAIFASTRKDIVSD